MKYTNAEMHFHTAETSYCASARACDSIPFYKENGYDLIVVTDHFNANYFNIPERPTAGEWRAACEKWLSGWREAKRAGKEHGVTVLLGGEFKLKDQMCEFLVYGLTEEMYLDHPKLYDMTVCELAEFAEKNGLFVAIAHPFREKERPDPVFYEGVEAVNGKLDDSRNDQARGFAEENGLIPICGQDFHHLENMRGIKMRFYGEVKDSETLIEKMRSKDYEIITH